MALRLTRGGVELVRLSLNDFPLELRLSVADRLCANRHLSSIERLEIKLAATRPDPTRYEARLVTEDEARKLGANV